MAKSVPFVRTSLVLVRLFVRASVFSNAYMIAREEVYRVIYHTMRFFARKVIVVFSSSPVSVRSNFDVL